MEGLLPTDSAELLIAQSLIIPQFPDIFFLQPAYTQWLNKL